MTDTTTAESQRRRSAACREGGQGRGRTADLTIFSRALYQLSYLTGQPAGAAGAGGPGDAQPAGTRPAGAELTGFEPATFTLTG